MTEQSMVISAPRNQVFAVLADGWSYAGWVVGASHIRDVDPGWPAVGSRIHHNVAPWPLRLHDVTEVLQVHQPDLLELRANAWPFGSATVRLELADDNGSTLARMSERVTGGIGKLIPDAVQAVLLGPRNAESLRRLESLARGRDPGQPEHDQPG